MPVTSSSSAVFAENAKALALSCSRRGSSSPQNDDIISGTPLFLKSDPTT
ncbi:MAG: hypothetical protein IJH32_01960 [Ruminococcus sp.]|nr:hypothetical protein [Ruminococcus sp.]